MRSAAPGLGKKRPERPWLSELAALVVENGPGKFSLKPQQLLGSMADVGAWSRLIGEMVIFACNDRSFFAVTEDPRGWSIDLDLGDTKEWTVDKKTYRHVHVPVATCAKLKEIAESEDFERGFLKLVFLPKDRENALAEVVQDQTGQDRLKIELLQRDGDGQVIEWFNPSRSRAELADHLVHLLEMTGWHMVA